ncbi:MAG: CRTAC1 family protein [Planctomycetota bacterium]|nr:MAG: CRTAC1 family protein [Planctomycetota bacterium]
MSHFLEAVKMMRMFLLIGLIGLITAGCSGSGDDPKTERKQSEMINPEKRIDDPLQMELKEVEKKPREIKPNPIVFEETGKESGLTVGHESAAHGQFRLVETMGGGVGLIDFNEDGLLDVFICQGSELPVEVSDKSRAAQLYQNQGDGKFVDVAEKAGVAFRGYGQGVAIGDYDGDGHADIYVSGFQSSGLYRNKGDGTFEELSEKAGLRNQGWATSSAFADLDKDGDLDLYVVRYLADTVDAAGRPTVTCNALPGQLGYCPPLAHNSEPDSLYRNNGDGTFTDIGPSIGLSSNDGNGLGLAIADFDEDGRLDIFVANDKTPCRFYHNLGNLKFEEVGLSWGLAYNESGEPTAAMGVAVGDADEDGRLDILVTNFYEEGATFYRNLGKGRFEVATSRARLKSPTRGRLGFGAGFVDFDNDGLLDLFITNGHVNDVRPLRMPYQMPPQLFQNLGKGRFEDNSLMAGRYFQKEWVGRGAAFGDFNNDGRSDILVTHKDGPPALLKNVTDPERVNHFIDLRLRPARVGGKEVSPVGSLVKVRLGDKRTLVRQLVGGTSYLSSHDSRLCIGLGPWKLAQSVEVRWPSGKSESWTGIKVDQIQELVEGQSAKIPN